MAPGRVLHFPMPYWLLGTRNEAGKKDPCYPKMDYKFGGEKGPMLPHSKQTTAASCLFLKLGSTLSSAWLRVRGWGLCSSAPFRNGLQEAASLFPRPWPGAGVENLSLLLHSPCGPLPRSEEKVDEYQEKSYIAYIPWQVPNHASLHVLKWCHR